MTKEAMQKKIESLVDDYFYKPYEVKVRLLRLVEIHSTRCYRGGEHPFVIVIHLRKSNPSGEINCYEHSVLCDTAPELQDSLEINYFFDCNLIDDVGNFMLENYKERMK